jgi:AAA+ ATPase superfamily predicted ATPase
MPIRGKVFDRTTEARDLERLLAEGQPRMVLVHGRRRVGKTYLLTNLWPQSTAFYFTAAETTPAQNRTALIESFAEWTKRPLLAADYPTWRTVFRLLLEYTTNGPFVLVIDEFQYLGDGESGLREVASELNAIWESLVDRPRHLLMVLSGSAVRTMERLNTAGAPLYGRFAQTIPIKPFDYRNAGDMSGFSSPGDRARIYGVFGGTPRYLAELKPSDGWEDNVQRLMLAPGGPVRDLVSTAIQQEQGLRDIPTYVAILRSIAGGRVGFNKLRQQFAGTADTALRLRLQRLEELGYVRETQNVGARPNAPRRYHIVDPALRFHYSLVAPRESLLARNSPAAVWDDYLASLFQALMGHVFEDVVEDAYHHLRTIGVALPMVETWGRWDGVDRQKRSTEIDIVALPPAGHAVMTGAIKWNQRPIGARVHTDHLDALSRLVASGVPWAHDAQREESPLIYAAAGGFTDEFKAVAINSRPNVILLTLEDLYR